jgi:very-short-patch-repair endonuclease
MNHDHLASRVAELVKTYSTHQALPAECEEIGLERSIPQDEGSKYERVIKRLDGKSAREIAIVAERAAIRYRDFDLEEAAVHFLEAGGRPLTEITRRDIARCFERVSLSGEQGLLGMLRRVCPVDSIGGSIPFGPSLADEIDRHMLRNDDWSVEDLFDWLGAMTWSRKRFLRLLEAALHPLARRGAAQDELRSQLEPILARDGYRFEVNGTESGYPIYVVTSVGSGVAGKPKNLIFASNGPKPEIGFSDAINNDILILSNEESCLVYDRHISDDGLLWSELVEWWKAEYCRQGTTTAEARRQLGQRLQTSLASDGERNFFASYFRNFRPSLGNALPALIPQVYLHYDPAVVARLRDRQSFPRQRMDFLLLLPQRTRVVIEVDGQHHFSQDNRPSLPIYAETMKADRDLRLLGYEVYRFAATELVGPHAQSLTNSFFQRLFEKHGVNF